MLKRRADIQLKNLEIWVRKKFKQRVMLLPRPACKIEIKEIQFCQDRSLPPSTNTAEFCQEQVIQKQIWVILILFP